jgi:exopolysaccharide biosynthesis polyprenyl glycosylphosphotransferase
MAIATETFRQLDDRLEVDARAHSAAIKVVGMPDSRARTVAPLVFLGFDVCALGLAMLLAGTSGWMGWAYALGAVAAIWLAEGYRLHLTLRALDEVPRLVGRLALPVVLVAPFALFTPVDQQLFVQVLLGIVFICVSRALGYALIRALRRHGRLLEPAVILGAGWVGAELARSFRDHPEYGIVPVGFLDAAPANRTLPVLGDFDRLDGLLADGRIRRVIVAFGAARGAELVNVLRTAVQHDVEVHVVPRFFDIGIAPAGTDTDEVRGIPLYRVRRAALRARAWWAKRVVDVVIGGTALVIIAPLLALIALAVRVSSPGPVLFRQRRVGQRGRELEVLKFRTLPINRDSDTQWSVIGDDRLTPIGRFLRRTSLDELPQLWSVVRGRMSLVGPRPERPHFVKRFTAEVDGYGDRHRVPSGLTGWAQVHGLRGDTSIEERARFDNHYIEHWSLWGDVVIMVRTAAELVRGALSSDR